MKGLIIGKVKIRKSARECILVGKMEEKLWSIALKAKRKDKRKRGKIWLNMKVSVLAIEKVFRGLLLVAKMYREVIKVG